MDRRKKPRPADMRVPTHSYLEHAARQNRKGRCKVCKHVEWDDGPGVRLGAVQHRLQEPRASISPHNHKDGRKLSDVEDTGFFCCQVPGARPGLRLKLQPLACTACADAHNTECGCVL
eukprot:357146-Chlamydomonas_euryale.AAC.3